MIEFLSIDLSNYCSKQCPFCYNHSRKDGNTLWKPSEIIKFASDCIKHGVKAVSLGGGEPFEYKGIFEIIDALYDKCYLSVTTNGLPLEDVQMWEMLKIHQPDKIHVTIHQPDNEKEVSRVENMIKCLSETKVKPGLNLLVAESKIEYAKRAYEKFIRIITAEQIILVPQRFNDTPSPKQLSYVANGNPFQAPSCILGCKRPENFASITWDKKVVPCSYASYRMPMTSLDYEGLCSALNSVDWKSCDSYVCED